MPKILMWDVETARMVLRIETYSLKQYSTYLSPDWIESDIWMPCASWKWLGDDYIASTSVLKDMSRFERDFRDDYHVIKTLYDLVNAADILIAHNGDNFDWKIFTARCVFHGLPPPKKPLMIDTLKAARKEFKFSSNSLRYLCRFLGLPLKDESPDWSLVAAGDADEILNCERYCRGDIKALEALYLRLRPYITNHPNLNAILEGVHHETCPKCSHWDIERRGYAYTKAGKYQRYSCRPQTGGCGGWFKSKKNLKTVELR